MELIVPNGAMQLLVNLGDDVLRWRGPGSACEEHLPGAALAGAFSHPFTIDTAQQRSITGVSFVPGGAAAFFNGSMLELSNKHVALSDLVGCRSIRGQLLEARSTGTKSVLRSWIYILEELFNPDRCSRSATARVLLEAGVPVQRAADVMSVSTRKLRQDFSASVGLSPKTYSRIHRLQRTVRSVANRQSGLDWASVAIEHGYFDQAHMIHDFRALTGSTPTSYKPLSPDDWNHSVLDADSYNP